MLLCLKKVLNLWGKHLLLEGYSVGLNLNHNTKITRWKIVERIASAARLLKASLHQFKLVNKTFFLKNSFNCESSNLIYVVICQGCKEEYIGQTDCLVKERIKICRQHTAAVSTIGSRRTFPYLWILKICMLPFFKIVQENKSLRKS